MKWIYGGENYNCGCLGGDWPWRVPDGSFSDENVLHLDGGSGYTGIYICQNSLNLNLIHCTIRELCLNVKKKLRRKKEGTVKSMILATPPQIIRNSLSISEMFSSKPTNYQVTVHQPFLYHVPGGAAFSFFFCTLTVPQYTSGQPHCSSIEACLPVHKDCPRVRGKSVFCKLCKGNLLLQEDFL